MNLSNSELINKTIKMFSNYEYIVGLELMDKHEVDFADPIHEYKFPNNNPYYLQYSRGKNKKW